MKNKIGILGGMGPLATTIFMRKVIDYTDAQTDQENVPMVILNDTEMPDRTDYLLGKSNLNPYPKLIKNIKNLENLGCNYIAMLCNTSHAFYNKLQENTGAIIINMVEETLRECKNRKFKKIGLLATEGTVNAKVYENFNKFNLNIFIPNYSVQSKINSFIYEYVKQDKKVSKDEFIEVLNYFYNNGCEALILGCTELSVIRDDLNFDNFKFVDSSSVIAKIIIKISGRKVKNKK